MKKGDYLEYQLLYKDKSSLTYGHNYKPKTVPVVGDIVKVRNTHREIKDIIIFDNLVRLLTFPTIMSN